MHIIRIKLIILFWILTRQALEDFVAIVMILLIEATLWLPTYKPLCFAFKKRFVTFDFNET